MSQKKKTASTRKRRRQRRRIMRLSAILLAALVLIAAGIFLYRSLSGDEDDVRTPEPTIEPQDTPDADFFPAESARPAITVTPLPDVTPVAAAPTPTPAPTPAAQPNVVSFYRPEGKYYSPRVRLDSEVTGPFKRETDIGSFEAIASSLARLEGEFFGDIFNDAWNRFPDTANCKIGYSLRYALDDGSEIAFTILTPSDIGHEEYIECWIYDDVHVQPYERYSHLKESRMKADTLISSIKLTGGSKIKHVKEIWLTTFIYTSEAEFDANRNYTGDVSCQVHITPA